MSAICPTHGQPTPLGEWLVEKTRDLNSAFSLKRIAGNEKPQRCLLTRGGQGLLRVVVTPGHWHRGHPHRPHQRRLRPGAGGMKRDTGAKRARNPFYQPVRNQLFTGG